MQAIRNFAQELDAISHIFDKPGASDAPAEGTVNPMLLESVDMEPEAQPMTPGQVLSQHIRMRSLPPTTIVLLNTKLWTRTLACMRSASLICREVQ